MGRNILCKFAQNTCLEARSYQILEPIMRYGGSEMAAYPPKSTPKCWVKPDRPYNSKSCGPILKKLIFLKNSDKNASNKKKNHLPTPLKGTVGNLFKIGQNRTFSEISFYSSTNNQNPIYLRPNLAMLFVLYNNRNSVHDVAS